MLLLVFFHLHPGIVFCQTYGVLLRGSKRSEFNQITLTLNTVLGGECNSTDQSYVVGPERESGRGNASTLGNRQKYRL